MCGSFSPSLFSFYCFIGSIQRTTGRRGPAPAGKGRARQATWIVTCVFITPWSQQAHPWAELIIGYSTPRRMLDLNSWWLDASKCRKLAMLQNQKQYMNFEKKKKVPRTAKPGQLQVLGITFWVSLSSGYGYASVVSAGTHGNGLCGHQQQQAQHFTSQTSYKFKNARTAILPAYLIAWQANPDTLYFIILTRA